MSPFEVLTTSTRWPSPQDVCATARRRAAAGQPCETSTWRLVMASWCQRPFVTTDGIGGIVSGGDLVVDSAVDLQQFALLLPRQLDAGRAVGAGTFRRRPGAEQDMRKWFDGPVLFQDEQGFGFGFGMAGRAAQSECVGWSGRKGRKKHEGGYCNLYTLDHQTIPALIVLPAGFTVVVFLRSRA